MNPFILLLKKKKYNLLKIFCMKRPLLLIIGFLYCLFFSMALAGQTDSTAQQEATEVTADEPALISPTLDLVTVQKSDNTIDLKASLKAKIKGTLTQLHSLKIKFYLVTDSAENELGTAITDRNGNAVLNVKAEQVVANKEGQLFFKAIAAGNKSMEGAEGEVAIKRAILTLTPVKEDSLLSVQVKLVDVGSGTETSVPEITLGIFVKRLFNPLKIGEGNTDENGEATIEIADNLPGDAKGNITLMAKLEENDIYGNLEAAAVVKWGIPVSDKLEQQPRALWSSHPPMWMLITFAILMVAVWGHYIVIVYELFRLRKEQPVLPDNATNS